MKLQVTIPETIVTLETKYGSLPKGTFIQLSVPVKELVTTPVTLSEVEGSSTPLGLTPAPAPPTPTPAPVIPAEEIEADRLYLIPTFDRKYEQVEFRNKRFDTLGKAPELGLSDSNWTMVLNVRFTTFDNHIRVIGSASVSGAGSSLQIGVLKGGILWVDTFHGAMTADRLELNKWYQIAVSHNRAGEEKIYIDKSLNRHTGNIPVFKSNDNVYVGRWGNEYADFDLSRVRIYPLLSDEEVKAM